jgi:hypothetical protein
MSDCTCGNFIEHPEESDLCKACLIAEYDEPFTASDEYWSNDIPF